MDVVLGDLDFDGRDDVVVSFGPPHGVWIYYNNGSWVRLDPRSPPLIAVGNVDDDLRDDVIIAYGGTIGTWVWANDSTWRKLHALNATDVTAGDFCDGAGLVVQFSPRIYLYCRDHWFYGPSGGYEWKQIHAGTAQDILTAELHDDGSPDEIVGDFGAQGTWILHDGGEFGGWVPLVAQNPQAMTAGNVDGLGRDDLVFSFGAAGTWIYYDDAFWAKKHALGAALLAAGDANRPPYTCLDLLDNGNPVEADDCLAARLAADPADQEAHLFKAITGVLRAVAEQAAGNDPTRFTDSFKEILNAFGVDAEDRNPRNFTAQFPEPLDGDAPRGEKVQEFLRTVLVGALGTGLDHLAQVDPDFETILGPDDATELDEPLDLDSADARLLAAFFHVFRGTVLLSLIAHDLDVDIDALQEVGAAGPFRLQEDLLDAYPFLLTLAPAGAADLAQAKADFASAIDAYYLASDFIRNADDRNQLDDLVTLEDEAAVAEDLQLRMALCEVRCSLEGQPCAGLDGSGFPSCEAKGGLPTIDGKPVDLAAVFDGRGDLRGLLPEFQWDDFCSQDYVDTGEVSETSPFPDPTLGGLFPAKTQQELLDDLEIPGHPEVYPGVQYFFHAHAPYLAYAFLDHEGEFSAPLTVNALDFTPGDHFAVQAKFLKLPVTLCNDDYGLFFEYSFDPPGPGAYQELLLVDTSLGSFGLPILACTGFPGDCNEDGFPDYFLGDLGRCDALEGLVPSPGEGGLTDPCGGGGYPDTDAGDGDGQLDDCDCDGIPDPYRDLGRCAAPGGLLPSPDSGTPLVDPCTKAGYLDGSPGSGDGRFDDCDCDGQPDR